MTTDDQYRLKRCSHAFAFLRFGFYDDRGLLLIPKPLGEVYGCNCGELTIMVRHCLVFRKFQQKKVFSVAGLCASEEFLGRAKSIVDASVIFLRPYPILDLNEGVQEHSRPEDCFLPGIL